jgi:tripartite-type tricarboxylate transporter receptor subunit TctC
VGGPKGLPQPIVEKLDAAVKAALQDPDFQRVVKNYGIRTDYRDAKTYTEFARTTFAGEKALVQSMGLND